MLPTLVVSRWPPPTRRLAFQLDPFEVAVEGQIEIQPRLFPVGDYIEAGGELVVDCTDYRIVLELGQIVRPKLLEILDGLLEPRRERVRANHSSPKGAR